jgi:alpha-tubulin suppressor-like RCC1 family protein
MVVLTASGKAYGVGYNNFGQLGLNDIVNRMGLTRIPHPEGDSAIFTQVYAHGRYGYNGNNPNPCTMLLSSSNVLYMCGRDYYNATGTKTTRPAIIEQLQGDATVDVFYSNNAHLMRTASRKVYAIGHNDYFTYGTPTGRFGIGNNNVLISLTEVPLIEGCVQVSVADESTMYLTTTGKIYSSGLNSSGQLGLGNTTDTASLALVPSISDETPVQIHTWGGNSMLLTASGKVYATGKNASGQFASGNKTSRSSFVLIPAVNSEIFSQVRIGTNHSCFLTTSGNVYMAGSNASGQLGLGTSDTTDRTALTQIPTIIGETFSKIAVCQLASFILTVSGKLYATGFNTFGELGVGDMNSPAVLTLVTGLNGITISNIFTGFGYVFCITASGDMYATGLNTSGQLGLGDLVNRTTFTNVPAIIGEVVHTVRCGMYTTFFLTNSGNVYTSGADYKNFIRTVPTKVPISV